MGADIARGDASRYGVADIRSLLEPVSEVAFQTDAERGLVWLNRAAIRLAGGWAEQLSRRDVAELVAPADREAVVAAFRRCLRDGEADVAVRLPAAGGEHRASWRLRRVPDGPRWAVIGVTERVAVSPQLAAELTLFRQVAESSGDAILITDIERRITYANPAFERITGYRRDAVLGETPAMLASGLHDAAFYRDLHETIYAGRCFRTVFVNRRADGELFHEDKTLSPVRDEDGQVTHFVSIGRDITERMQMERRHDQLAAILEETPDLVGIAEPDGRVVYHNRALRELLGITESEIELDWTIPRTHPDWAARRLRDEALPEASETGHWQGESAVLAADGREVPVSQLILVHFDEQGRPERLSTIMRDISAQKRVEADLAYQAYHDRLTGIANRARMEELLDQEMDRAGRYADSFAAVLLDLDYFKRINDTWGHAVGDEVLQQLARLISADLRCSDSVARWGGEEFLLLLPHTRAAGARAQAERMRSLIESHHFEPVGRVTVSIGVAVHDSGETRRQLLRRADAALYRAKESGRNRIELDAPAPREAD